MKVCFVIPTLTGGGAERVAVTVLSALNAARYERTLYVFSAADGVYFDRLGSGIQVVVATHRSWLMRLWELAGFLRATRPAIVMPFLSYFITALAVWLSGARARVVFNQGTPTSGFLDDPDFRWHGGWRQRVFALMTRFFYRRADAVVVTSQGVAEDLATGYGVPRTHMRVLHNPVDLDAVARADASRVPPRRAGERVIVSAGRLARVKNFPLLIEALDLLNGEMPVSAWILGDGEERSRLERLAAASRAAGRVTFAGFQPQPWAWMAHADVFVLTSVYEGFGNVLIEAMACGVPVVATRSPGTSEIITSGVNGLLVEHTAAAVAGAVLQLLRDEALRRRLIDQARQDVRHYATPAVAQRYEQLFDELVA